LLERVVELWLTSATERAYEAPFSQLLSLEGYTVLQGPAHHPYEHGKDIVALSADGDLCGFQLKSGDLHLPALEKIHGQLLALATTAIDYPGVSPPRPPDKAYLVTTGALTPPARDRLRSLNTASRSRGICEISLVEKENLVARFSRSHWSFVPTSVEDMDSLLQFLMSDGRGPFDTERLLALIQRISSSASDGASSRAVSRMLGSTMLLAAYSTRNWLRADNHMAVAQAWASAAIGTLAVGT